MAGNQSVSIFLEKAESNQAASCADLLNKLTRFGTAAKAVNPQNKGVYKDAEIIPVVFGNKNNQVQIDFKPLVDSLKVQLQGLKEEVIDAVISSVDTTLKDARIEETEATRMLRESFLSSDVLSAMNLRFDNFFSAKRHELNLRDGNVAEHMRKLAVTQRVTALQTVVLSKHSQATNLAQVKALIEENMAETRDKWKQLVTASITTFVTSQATILINDLVGNSRNKGGLLKELLLSFLQHIVQTDKMKSSAILVSEFRTFLNDLGWQTKSSHALWAKLTKHHKPEELGRAAARFSERRRQRELVHRRAEETASNGIGLQLGRPTSRMPELTLTPSDRATLQPVVFGHCFSRALVRSSSTSPWVVVCRCRWWGLGLSCQVVAVCHHRGRGGAARSC